MLQQLNAHLPGQILDGTVERSAEITDRSQVFYK